MAAVNASRTASARPGLGEMVATIRMDNRFSSGRVGRLTLAPTRPGDDDAGVAEPAADRRRPLRVAVVGAGPAGIYAAEALAGQDGVPVAVDLVDRLPTPFGLVRHGIAPDHLKMRALRETLRNTLDNDHVRFVGNVEIGRDIELDDLRRSV